MRFWAWEGGVRIINLLFCPLLLLDAILFIRLVANHHILAFKSSKLKKCNRVINHFKWQVYPHYNKMWPLQPPWHYFVRQKVWPCGLPVLPSLVSNIYYWGNSLCCSLGNRTFVLCWCCQLLWLWQYKAWSKICLIGPIVHYCQWRARTWRKDTVFSLNLMALRWWSDGSLHATDVMMSSWLYLSYIIIHLTVCRACYHFHPFYQIKS